MLGPELTVAHLGTLESHVAIPVSISGKGACGGWGGGGEGGGEVEPIK